MGVAMMNVGPVHMAMRQGGMSVEMIVFAGRFQAFMQVLVVFVVLVRMGMRDAFMPV